MKTLTYINSKGEKLVFTNKAPLMVLNLDSSNSLNIYSDKGMNQDGQTYLGNTLDVQDITLKVIIMASTPELINQRNQINKVFNPRYGEGYLVYKDEVNERKIKCIINKLPYFVTTGNVAEGLISITASNPFWMDMEESKEEIALWQGGFKFPLELVAGGIQMGHRAPSLIVNVINSGDIECGMRIEFKALATLTNPSLLNLNTGEYIKINKSMVAGEIISIRTYFGDKKIQSNLGGAITNIFNYIDFNSTFLQLEVGDNLFKYEADTGVDNLEVSIYYNNQYLGV